MDTTASAPPLRALRTRRRESAKDLAAVVGVDKGLLSRVERGRARASVRLLVAVADHYALTDAELGTLVRDVHAYDPGGRP